MAHKVLFIEDDLIFGTLITKGLEKRGLEVCFRDTLDDIIDVIATFCPDIAVLDLEVGNQNSFGYLPSIRANYLSLPILFESSHTGGSQIEQCIRAGVKHYIKKPYEIEELASYIDRLLPLLPSSDIDCHVFGKFALKVSTHELYWEDCLERRLPMKDFQVLHQLLLKQRETVTRTELLNSIWHNDLAEESLNNILTNLRKIVKKDSRIEIQTIKKTGYTLVINKEYYIFSIEIYHLFSFASRSFSILLKMLFLGK